MERKRRLGEVSVYLGEELGKKIEDYAKEAYLSKSTAIRYIVGLFFKNKR